MKIPKYWSRGTAQEMDANGRSIIFSCSCWSELSESDARQKAEARAKELLHKWLAGEEFPAVSYPYSDGARPLREEAVQAVSHGKKEIAVITRNSYGALVLNAADAMFLDIDFEPETLVERLRRLAGNLFGQKPATMEARRIAEVEKFADRHRDLALRVYRTFAGLRCLVTNQTFDPLRSETKELMKELGCDPLYIKLCRHQECFRARLTPKPWRCRMEKPPVRYPFASANHENRFREWEQKYKQTASHYSVCRLVAHFGDSRIHPEIEPILSLHDKFCCPASELPLA